MDKVKFAIIGCGAVTENFHLPALQRSAQAEVEVLVDPSTGRARQLAEMYGVPAVAEEYSQVIGKADAAIVAVPNYLHATVAEHLLEAGVHVLVEKPMALTPAACDRISSAAEKNRAVLTVGLVRRFLPASGFVKEMLESGMLGEIQRIDIQEGVIFSWPVASGAMFRKANAGGGVLMDIGVHILDLLLWWFGPCKSVDYADDAMGGVEADCRLKLMFAGKLRADIELSRTRNLRNSCIITGSRASLEVECNLNPELCMRVGSRSSRLCGRVALQDKPDTSYLDAFIRQLADFTEAILRGGRPLVTAAEGKRSVELIESCYAARKPLNLPWTQP